MKKQTSSTVMMPRSGRPIEAVMAAPERYRASKPAARACSAAMPLWAPGSCRMPGRPSRARKRSPAGTVGRSAATRYGIPSSQNLSASRSPAPPSDQQARSHDQGGSEPSVEVGHLGEHEVAHDDRSDHLGVVEGGHEIGRRI